MNCTMYLTMYEHLIKKKIYEHSEKIIKKTP